MFLRHNIETERMRFKNDSVGQRYVIRKLLAFLLLLNFVQVRLLRMELRHNLGSIAPATEHEDNHVTYSSFQSCV